MHQRALHGVAKTALGTFARGLSRRAEPRVKLH
jgi:NADH:ubiquinone reductase (H+-translocating)